MPSARHRLWRLLCCIESRDGVDRVAVDAAMSAITQHRRDAEAIRLMEALLREIDDDGPTDETLGAAKREAQA